MPQHARARNHGNHLSCLIVRGVGDARNEICGTMIGDWDWEVSSPCKAKLSDCSEIVDVLSRGIGTVRGLGSIAIGICFLASAGAAIAQQPACVIAQKSLQFCIAPVSASPDCSCTDWAGRRVYGFVDPLLTDRLRTALDRKWFRSGNPNEQWLQSKADSLAPPPYPATFWCKPEHLGRWGPEFLFSAPEKIFRPQSGPNPRYPGIVPIGPWPTPPGWPPKR